MKRDGDLRFFIANLGIKDKKRTEKRTKKDKKGQKRTEKDRKRAGRQFVRCLSKKSGYIGSSNKTNGI